MKKFNLRDKLKNIKLQKVSIDDLDDRMLLINLYMTQGLTLLIGIIILFFQKRNVISLFYFQESWNFAIWGGIFALLVILVDLAVSRFVPEDATDDGGVNDKLFRNRPVWHIAVISFIVSVCEELLFRGAIQHAFGPYWTSILFAAIHIRYLRHWIPTGLVFSISYGLGWIYIQTGSLWTPIVAHFIIDLIMGLIIRFRRDT